MQTAILIHCLNWESQSDEVTLDTGLKLCRAENSRVEKLYHSLCKRNDLDQGDPFHYPTYVLIDESQHNDHFPFWGGPHSIVSICCNIIAICTSEPLSMCRLISSRDNFRTSLFTSTIYEASEDSDVIRERLSEEDIKGDSRYSYRASAIGRLDDITLQEIRACWEATTSLWELDKTDNHRIENALNYFFYAWRSYHMDQVCINLAIVLESLFSPSQPQELSHQVAFNTAHFVGSDATERELVYKTIKTFYNVRSQIVHGGKARDRDLYITTPEVFHICASILRRILINSDLTMSFSFESARSAMIKKWMFGVSAQ